jgi:putative redox protein
MGSDSAATSRFTPTDGPDSATGAPWVTVQSAGAAAGYRTDVRVRGHAFVADEPASAGGSDLGPTPVDYLLGAVGACTAITLRMYARRKGWPLERATVELRPASPSGEEPVSRVGAQRIERRIELHGPLTADQRRRLLTLANRCPVKGMLERGFSFEARP